MRFFSGYAYLSEGFILQQLKLWSGGVLNRTASKASGRDILSRHDAKKYLDHMMKMLRGETK